MSNLEEINKAQQDIITNEQQETNAGININSTSAQNSAIIVHKSMDYSVDENETCAINKLEEFVKAISTENQDVIVRDTVEDNVYPDFYHLDFMESIDDDLSISKYLNDITTKNILDVQPIEENNDISPVNNSEKEIKNVDIPEQPKDVTNENINDLFTVNSEKETKIVDVENLPENPKPTENEQSISLVGKLRIKNIYELGAKTNIAQIFIRKCEQCSSKIFEDDVDVIFWQTMEFCRESCLSQYQSKIGSKCEKCRKVVWMSCIGKYCVRFGHFLKQFCCLECLESFKKTLKLCSFCQNIVQKYAVSTYIEGHLKEFCTIECSNNYVIVHNEQNDKNGLLLKETSVCTMCEKEKSIEFILEEHKDEIKINKLCSSTCLQTYTFLNQLYPIECDLCKKYFEKENLYEFSFYLNKSVKNFCSATCRIVFIVGINYRIIECTWCKVKKRNLDMIKKKVGKHKVSLCSLNCLSLYKVSVTNEFKNLKKLATNLCNNNTSTIPSTTGAQNVQTKSISSNEIQNKSTSSTENQNKLPNQQNNDKLPKNVANNDQQTVNISRPLLKLVKFNLPVPPAGNLNQPSGSQNVAPVKQQLIVQAPPLPPMSNAATLCKPITKSKGISCRPSIADKQTQTEMKEKIALLPMPCPIYVPAPLPMYAIPVPVPIPFPIPIPVPLFFPTLCETEGQVITEIKRIMSDLKNGEMGKENEDNKNMEVEMEISEQENVPENFEQENEPENSDKEK